MSDVYEYFKKYVQLRIVKNYGLGIKLLFFFLLWAIQVQWKDA